MQEKYELCVNKWVKLEIFNFDENSYSVDIWLMFGSKRQDKIGRNFMNRGKGGNYEKGWYIYDSGTLCQSYL